MGIKNHRSARPTPPAAFMWLIVLVAIVATGLIAGIVRDPGAGTVTGRARDTATCYRQTGYHGPCLSRPACNRIDYRAGWRSWSACVDEATWHRYQIGDWYPGAGRG